MSLNISPEKTKSVNLKHNHTEFLGFKIKVRKKGKTTRNHVACDKYVVRSHVSDKALKKIHEKAAAHISNIQRCKSKGEMAEYYAVSNYNSYVMGIHNYYRMEN